jgi:hypothetical protein
MRGPGDREHHRGHEPRANGRMLHRFSGNGGNGVLYTFHEPSQRPFTIGRQAQRMVIVAAGLVGLALAS